MTDGADKYREESDRQRETVCRALDRVIVRKTLELYRLIKERDEI